MTRKTTLRFVARIILFIYCCKLGTSSEQAEHQESVFMELTDEAKYNKHLRPGLSQEGPLLVNTSIYLYSMASLDERHTEYTVHLVLRQSWRDERLELPMNSSLSVIEGDYWHAGRIWTPTMHIANNKDIGAINKVGMGALLLRIQPTGDVLLSKRTQLKLICYMKFQRYPMDRQTCMIELESSTLSENHLELEWDKEGPFYLGDNFQFPGFIISNYSLEKTTTVYSRTGNFSKLVILLYLKREFSHFLFDIYIPSILFVITSWTSFWIDIPAAPARVTLGITTMLTLVTSAKSAREKLPKISYVHALDVWIVVCTGFIFVSLLEYAMVNYIYHKDKNRKKYKRRKNKRMAGSSISLTSSASESGSTFSIMSYFKKGDSFNPKDNPAVEMRPQGTAASNGLPDTVIAASTGGDDRTGLPQPPPQIPSMDIANSIDKKSRYLFPICFALFNMLYWSLVWV